MNRIKVSSRDHWKDRCKEVGFDFCDLPSQDGSPYWSEGVAYHFSSAEIDQIEEATNELHKMSMDLVDKIISSGDYPSAYSLSMQAKQLIEESWKSKELHLYGRFDLSFSNGSIKMLEYNADTPTSLIESAVAQWNWLEDLELPDQFNSIHESLIDRWSEIRQLLPVMNPSVYFTATNQAGREDWGNLDYMMETALQAGINVSELAIEDFGWDQSTNKFTDLNDKPILTCFKLYPWEWLLADSFGSSINSKNIRFIEPAWKMLLSSKALLPILWERNKNHPLLLPSYADSEAPKTGKWVRKPILSREGANISLIENGKSSVLPGSPENSAYGAEGYIIQQWVDLPCHQNFYSQIGSWVVGDNSVGIGMREDTSVVISNDAHFVPHYFD